MRDDGDAQELQTFIAELPKVELHVHHVGSASPRIVAELAARHEGSSPVPADPDRLREYFEFQDLAHFIETYLSVVDLIRTPDDVAMLTYEIASEMSGQAVRYAELTVTPYTSITKGNPCRGVLCGAGRRPRSGQSRFRCRACLVLRHPRRVRSTGGRRDAGHRAAGATGRPGQFRARGPEVGVPRPQFAPHFERARAAGLHSVPHAGESTGLETIWDALNHLGAERIGHGIAAARDPELMAHLAAEDIMLEICPTSNVRTRSVPSPDEHPLPVLVAAGVPVTINSDDPPMFSTTLRASEREWFGHQASRGEMSGSDELVQRL